MATQAPGSAGYPPPYRWHELPEPTPRYERNSVGMMTTGIVLTSLGGLLGVSTLLVALADGATSGPGDSCTDYANTRCDEGDVDESDRTGAYVVAGIGSGAAVLAGIPLIVVGARRVPVEAGERASTSRLPSIAVGPGSARLAWSW